MRALTDDEPSEDGPSFTDRVLLLFSQSVLVTGIGVLIGIVNARMLGPSGKGDFYLLTLFPASVLVLLQLGLPSAFGYFAARGQVKGSVSKAMILTIALCLPALVVAVALVPVLQETILRGLDQRDILLALCALPIALNATFSVGILLGRQGVRGFAAANIVQSLVSITLFVVLVGVMGLGVFGAVLAFVLYTVVGAGGWLIAARRAVAAVDRPRWLSYRELFRYGLPLFPGSLTEFFSYRVDVFLLAFLLVDASAPIGYYSMAVTIAGLVFFLPNAVSTLFFPHVAGSSRADADRQVPMVCRVTLLTTGTVALALGPAAIILIHVLLPEFEPSLQPLFVLLPGVVALSLTKVLHSYVAGVGLSGWTSVVSVTALVVNVVANLILIPILGIVGAALASLISYSISSLSFSVMAAHISHSSVLDFWIPRSNDVRFAVDTSTSMARRLLRRPTSS